MQSHYKGCVALPTPAGVSSGNSIVAEDVPTRQHPRPESRYRGCFAPSTPQEGDNNLCMFTITLRVTKMLGEGIRDLTGTCGTQVGAPIVTLIGTQLGAPSATKTDPRQQQQQQQQKQRDTRPAQGLGSADIITTRTRNTEHDLPLGGGLTQLLPRPQTGCFANSTHTGGRIPPTLPPITASRAALGLRLGLRTDAPSNTPPQPSPPQLPLASATI
jgi:hypothetical protein